MIRARRSASIAARYALFAALSMGVNLLVQRLVHAISSSALVLYAGILGGTAAGLSLKYVLDKRFIFHYKAASPLRGLGTFVLYGLMGALTTAVFWGTELVFDMCFAFPSARYAGALIGLTAGYAAKYFLDNRFVFSRRR